ncbi:unnamed protein product [Ambrosiozyma monospora]|uniref:Unnamed protein product n=1 Tax=Ambrosiozyma monospora TaxID=43982 RepID=A0ACB5TA68_AMBMO|nr:unnamed protein product [Ambrosiozyma monospora]
MDQKPVSDSTGTQGLLPKPIESADYSLQIQHKNNNNVTTTANNTINNNGNSTTEIPNGLNTVLNIGLQQQQHQQQQQNLTHALLNVAMNQQNELENTASKQKGSQENCMY